MAKSALNIYFSTLLECSIFVLKFNILNTGKKTTLVNVENTGVGN